HDSWYRSENGKLLSSQNGGLPIADPTLQVGARLWWSVGRFEGLDRPPAVHDPLVHRVGKFFLTGVQTGQGGRQLGDGLVGPQGLVVHEVDEPTVVEFHQRVRVKLL